jgi:hypothetical protein
MILGDPLRRQALQERSLFILRDRQLLTFLNRHRVLRTQEASTPEIPDSGVEPEVMQEEQTSEQPEEQTAQGPEEHMAEQMAVEERQEVHHSHRIHHNLTVKEPVEDICLDCRDVLKNWNLRNLLKLKNPRNFMGREEKTLIPGGYWYKSILRINVKNFPRTSESSIG